MRFRRKRRTKVFWLPGNRTFVDFTSGLDITANQTATYFTPLIADDDATAEQQTNSASGMNVYGRMGPQANLVIDRIVGKVFWRVKNDSTDVDELLVCRMAIVKIPRQAGQGISQVGATPTSDLWSLDPSTGTPSVLGGTDAPRYLWWRDWCKQVGPIAVWDSESMCPPGPYVDIRPKCNLRATEALYLLTQFQANYVGGSGPAQFDHVHSHSLRVLAHHKVGS